MAPWRSAQLVLGLILCLSTLSRAQQPPDISEYELKAAFLFQFPHFVEWPVVSPDTATTLCIGILGDDPFGPAFQTIEGKEIKGKTLQVKRARDVEDLLSCPILFISSSEEKRLPETLPKLKDRNILTVGGKEGFARKGVIINFHMEKKNVRFEVNMDAAERSSLRVSSRLLRLATVIREPQGGGGD